MLKSGCRNCGVCGGEYPGVSNPAIVPCILPLVRLRSSAFLPARRDRATLLGAVSDDELDDAAIESQQPVRLGRGRRARRRAPYRFRRQALFLNVLDAVDVV